MTKADFGPTVFWVFTSCKRHHTRLACTQRSMTVLTVMKLHILDPRVAWQTCIRCVHKAQTEIKGEVGTHPAETEVALRRQSGTWSLSSLWWFLASGSPPRLQQCQALEKHFPGRTSCHHLYRCISTG